MSPMSATLIDSYGAALVQPLYNLIIADSALMCLGPNLYRVQGTQQVIFAYEHFNLKCKPSYFVITTLLIFLYLYYLKIY